MRGRFFERTKAVVWKTTGINVIANRMYLTLGVTAGCLFLPQKGRAINGQARSERSNRYGNTHRKSNETYGS